MTTPREDAARRVAALHPPLPRIFASLRETFGSAPDPVDVAIREGVSAARAAGVPAHDVDVEWARSVAGGDLARARNAGVLAAVHGPDGWVAVQRFGERWCPSPGCYGRDGAMLADEAPPFAFDCNCSAEPVQVR